LQGAREEHTKAITERMDSVKEMREVVPLTQNLYAVAKVRRAEVQCENQYRTTS
jgi:F-type H+-transporting ATPase subunit b